MFVFTKPAALLRRAIGLGDLVDIEPDGSLPVEGGNE